ncbi:MAG: ElyC/SanA/YdcF family protein [Bacillota bacterium]|nr:ElyC/SanA/YdcF family protein [Bacillota bacterium]
MSKREKKRSYLARAISLFIKLIIVAVLVLVGLDIFMIKTTEDQIAASLDSETDSITAEETEALKSIDPQCILVLGASVNNDGTPSRMLKDRLDLAISLYHAGVAPKLLLSGDNGQVVYNEVNVMKNYAVNAGVPESDIFLDHAGFSTYESVYRSDYIFKVDSMVVVTQKYHMYRALYGCNRMDITALGATSDQKDYHGQDMREIREFLARDKDCIKWIFKPKPTFLGDAIPISGSGISTH